MTALKSDSSGEDYEEEVVSAHMDRVARMELHIARVEEATVSSRNLIAGIFATIVFMGLVYFSLVLYVLFFAPKPVGG